jgi:hypothetical protein
MMQNERVRASAATVRRSMRHFLQGPDVAEPGVNGAPNQT